MNENGASDEPDSDESIFSLQSPRQKKKYITEILVIPNKTEDNILIKFQVDTGASCSTITLKDYKKITHEMPEKSNVKLKLYDQSLIPPIGSTKLYCTANGVRKKVHFEIVEYASTSLLSGRASEALRLIHFNEECILHVDLTSDESLTQEKILHNYRDVFTGLGKLPGTYHRDMHPNAIPVQENPRRVPIPVKDELKSKIEELETMGVTAKVAKPTSWISNMVAVRKSNKLKQCLDPLQMNKGIVRNHYPTPTVEDIAPKLTKA